MSGHVTLDEMEEYEREVLRARAENRVPWLKNPHDVKKDTLGNAESFLEEKTDSEVNKEEKERNRQLLLAEQADAKLVKVIKSNGGSDDPKNIERLREIDDAFSDNNAPRTNEDGEVLGSDVNPKFTRGMTTFDAVELAREELVHAVPQHEKEAGYDDPRPQVIEQGVVLAQVTESDDSSAKKPAKKAAAKKATAKKATKKATAKKPGAGK